jgi:hypothetical protein
MENRDFKLHKFGDYNIAMLHPDVRAAGIPLISALVVAITLTAYVDVTTDVDTPSVKSQLESGMVYDAPMMKARHRASASTPPYSHFIAQKPTMVSKPETTMATKTQMNAPGACCSGKSTFMP